jgi:hypothetical protein
MGRAIREMVGNREQWVRVLGGARPSDSSSSRSSSADGPRGRMRTDLSIHRVAHGLTILWLDAIIGWAEREEARDLRAELHARPSPCSSTARSCGERPRHGRRWVVLDIGETLIDETRIWSTWADVLGVPRFTLHAVIGGVAAQGGDHRDAFALLGIDDWQAHEPQVQARYGGFRREDLYPTPCRRSRAASRGLGVAVIGNQPASRTASSAPSASTPT